MRHDLDIAMRSVSKIESLIIQFVSDLLNVDSRAN